MLPAISQLGLYGGPQGILSAIATIDGVLFTKTQIVVGGQTIEITLFGDIWVAASGGVFDAQRQNILDGLTSAQSELLGWNNEVRDKEVVTAVVRTSDNVVTITLTASALYDITSSDNVTDTIPSTALVGGAEVIAVPLIVVNPDVGGAVPFTARHIAPFFN